MVRGQGGMANRATSKVVGDSRCYSTVSSNVGAQLVPGRGEVWASGAGETRYLSQHHPSSHTSCTAWPCCRDTLAL